MFFKPYYLGCLAHASYMVGDKGEAVVIDPQRDVDEYLEDAIKAKVRIVGIVETHLHADFVSGHVELAERSGAKIYVSHLSKVEYDHVPVAQDDEIRVGGLTLRVLETPGHTPESISLLLIDGGVPTHLFSGDTLFIGEIGRPDLAGWRGHSRDEMASDMFRSLRDQILPLPDSVEVWPAHGAGSACGKAISDEPSSPLGVQKRENWGLRLVAAGNEAAFLAELTAGLPRIPPYFPHDVVANRRGSLSIGAATADAKPLSPEEFEAEMRAGALVLDTRAGSRFTAGHVPGSITVGLDGKFAPWVGVVVPSTARILVVADPGREGEAIVRLARIGYDHVDGWLDGGMPVWEASERAMARMREVSAAEVLAERPRILDVRTPTEWADGHLEGSLHIPLLELEERLSEVPEGQLAVMCHSGYRSAIACSLLQRRGKNELANVTGGWGAISALLAEKDSATV